MAVLFDFNGVLVEDSHFHEQAWAKIALDEFGICFSSLDKDTLIHGRQNGDILNILSKGCLTEAEIERLSEEKEKRYRRLCLSAESDFRLADGAITIFDRLVDEDIPFTIVSSTDISNMLFYFDIFNLDKWFRLDYVVTAHPSIKSKPAPHSFELAAKLLNRSTKDCIVIEDSRQGIEAARSAKSKGIIAIGPPSRFDEFYRLGATCCRRRLSDVPYNDLVPQD